MYSFSLLVVNSKFHHSTRLVSQFRHRLFQVVLQQSFSKNDPDPNSPPVFVPRPPFPPVIFFPSSSFSFSSYPTTYITLPRETKYVIKYENNHPFWLHSPPPPYIIPEKPPRLTPPPLVSFYMPKNGKVKIKTIMATRWANDRKTPPK